ncbi:hypothetical protein B0T22DRAFT_166321 [Podospora appendiculata]|uniref:Secreted protein n=1 Tax=Podospora appendiculata TaxID=314037 RepID=A0AAE0XBA4_9PEZI|nr:hypothetical protein B0T22DRAFT_166321 [Podospora appendiculata]
MRSAACLILGSMMISAGRIGAVMLCRMFVWPGSVQGMGEVHHIAGPCSFRPGRIRCSQGSRACRLDFHNRTAPLQIRVWRQWLGVLGCRY